MFLAHMPAGFLASRFLLSQFKLKPSKSKWLLTLGLLGSVFPDLDMLYFYLIDDRQHNHHSYWTHIPFYWFCLLSIFYFIAAILKSRFIIAAATLFIGCVLLHLLLDTFAGGGIKWLYPLNSSYFNIFTVPPRHGYWLWNYFLHWTALVELLIIYLAASIFWKKSNKYNRNIRRQS